MVDISQRESIDTMSKLAAFLWAAGGSLALEIVSLYNEIKAERPSGVPQYYRSPIFWGIRMLVAGVAGGLAVAESANNPLLAVTIGASAPAIMQVLSKSADPRPS